MWSGWVETLASELEAATGTDLRDPLFAMMAYDPASGRARAGGGLASTPMARLRDMTREVLLDVGATADLVESALAAAWRSPDPVDLAHPLTDLASLFGGLRSTGRRIAVATSDDRSPTLRTLAALSVADLVDAIVCADDGFPTKPAPDMVHHLCAGLGLAPEHAAVIGDSPADIAMGRAAGAGLVIGVRTGIGTDDDLVDADVIVDDAGALRAV
jgi:phosphoglycolate phosphatase